MIDPTYPATITVGGANSSYQFNAFPQPTQSIGGLSGLLSLQSFILPITLQTSASAQYDISGATATLYITAANDEDYTPVLLASGVLSDSGAFGGGVTDTVTFTVPKSLIPNNLGAYGKTRAGNSKVYAVLSDADTYLEFFEGVNVYDTQFGGGGGATPGSLQINNNNLGVVVDTLDAPPGSPTTLDAYLVGTSPSGVWLSPSDLSDNLVIWSGAAWIPTAPTEGDFLFDADEDTQKRYNGTAWTTEDAKPFSDDSPLVNNTADPTRLLTISAASITTGTTRTITAADVDVDMADIAVNTAKLTADETNVVAALDGATLTAVTVATGDKVVIQDVSDTDNIKTVTAQSIADLAAAGVGVYRNIYIDAAAMVPRDTNGAEALTKEFATNDIMIDYLAYDSTTEEGAQFKMMLPDEWDLSTIKFKFYWDAAATASGTCIWGVKAGAYSDSDAIDAALGTQITVTDTLLTVGDVHISPATAAVTVGGTPALADMIVFQVVATTGGTIAVDQFLMGVSIQYKELTTPPVIW